MRATFIVACVCPLVLIMLAWKAPPKWVYIAWIAASLLFCARPGWTSRRFGRSCQPTPGPRAAIAEPPDGARPAGQLWSSTTTFSPRASVARADLCRAFVLWGAIRDWPFRSYRLAIPGFAFAAGVAHMGVVTEADLQQWRAVWCAAFVLAVMAVGILDYVTLARVFGSVPRSEQSTMPTPFEHLALLSRVVHDRRGWPSSPRSRRVTKPISFSW